MFFFVYFLQVRPVHSVSGGFDCRYDRSLGAPSILSSGEVVGTCSISEGGALGGQEYSKPFLLFSATDAASAAIDFSRGDLEQDVVNSPPSSGGGRIVVNSPSPLKLVGRCTPRRERSTSPTLQTALTPQRQLYGGLGSECDPPVVETLANPVVSFTNLDHVVGTKSVDSIISLPTPITEQHGRDRVVSKHAMPTMSSGAPKPPRLSRFQPTRSCSSTGPDLATLKRQMRDSLAHPILRLQTKTSVFAESHPRTVSRRGAIMKAMEELKAREEMKSRV